MRCERCRLGHPVRAFHRHGWSVALFGLALVRELPTGQGDPPITAAAGSSAGWGGAKNTGTTMKNHLFQIFERQIAQEKSKIKELKEAFDIAALKLLEAEQRERDVKALLIRAADALEDAPIEHAKGCPVSGICVCEPGKERVSIVDDLRTHSLAMRRR